MTGSDALRRAVLLVAGGVLWLVGAPVLHAQSPPATKTVSDTVALPSSGTVTVDNHRGSITITTWDRAEVGYRVRIEPATEDEDVQFTGLDVTRPGDATLDLEPDFPWRFQIPGLITISPGGTERALLHYTLAVPQSARLEIDSHAGSVELSGAAGSTEIDTYSGPVRGSNLRGELELDTYSGPVQLTFARLTAPLSIESVQGSMRLTLPKDAGFDLEADLQSADQLTSGAPFSLPSPDGTDYEGPVNGGGPLVSIESISGPIELRAH